MGVSKNNGTPKSSISIGFFIINHPFWGVSLFLETPIYIYIYRYKSHVYTYVPSLTHTNGRACPCAGEPDPAADPVADLAVDRTPRC